MNLGPCEENQRKLIASKVVDFCKEVISMFQRDTDYKLRGFFTSEQKEKANEIVDKSSLLLISLLEGNTTKDIAESLTESLDLY